MDLKNRKIIVTGGAGFIGSHVVDVLAEHDCEVVVVDDLSTGSVRNIRRRLDDGTARLERADIRSQTAMESLIGDADVVLHMAVACVRTSLNDPVFVHETNAGGTLNVAIAAQRNEVGRLVYVSSSEAYGSAQYVPMDEDHPTDPTTVYGASKLVGEGYALAMERTCGMEVTIIRPFNSYGPREPDSGKRAEVIPKFVLRTMAGDRPVIFGDGTQTRDFTWVEDTARGIVAATACDDLVGKRVNVARGQEISIRDVAAKVLTALGRSGEEACFDAPRPGDVDRHHADTALAGKHLDWQPRMSIDEGLQRYIAWLLETGIDPQEWFQREVTRNW
ncbi:MAG: NAD-dependent epimerase/dehydratase family protein [Actinomycetia bacterium]|nr:NAD-dependent epimerase/dehydratase family protein [Actinomycetes bacterium]